MVVQRKAIPQIGEFLLGHFESGGDFAKRRHTQIRQQADRRAAGRARAEQQRVAVTGGQQKHLGPKVVQPLAQFETQGNGRGGVCRRPGLGKLFVAAGARRCRNPGRFAYAGHIGHERCEARKINRAPQNAQYFQHQRPQRMRGKWLFAQPVNAACNVRGVRRGLTFAPEGVRAGGSQRADGSSIGIEPHVKVVTGADDVTQAFAQAVALGEAAGEEAVDRVGRDASGKSVKGKVRRRYACLANRPQPAEQFQHGFAGQFGGVQRCIERAQALPDHTIQYGRSAIGQKDFEDAVGVIVGYRAGEITLEEFLADHDIGLFRGNYIRGNYNGWVRVVLLVAVALAACPVFCLGADADLASALLAAKNADERAILLRGHDQVELAAALEGIEKSAGALYDKKDYPAALNAYEAALLTARETGAAAKVPFYFRRTGLSHALLGQNDAALASYRDGTTAAEATGDDVMLAENLHGSANILQRIGRYREALPFCERELALTEKAGEPEAMIRALNTYAQTLGELGRYRQALPLQERALELSRRSSRPDDYPLNLANLAMYYGSLGDDETSLRLLQSIPEPTANSLDVIAVEEVRVHREADAEASCGPPSRHRRRPASGEYKRHRCWIWGVPASTRQTGRCARQSGAEPGHKSGPSEQK